MSHFDHLMATRDKAELAKLVVALAKENSALKNRVDFLEHENFWLQAKERTNDDPHQ